MRGRKTYFVYWIPGTRLTKIVTTYRITAIRNHSVNSLSSRYWIISLTSSLGGRSWWSETFCTKTTKSIIFCCTCFSKIDPFFAGCRGCIRCAWEIIITCQSFVTCRISITCLSKWKSLTDFISSTDSTITIIVNPTPFPFMCKGFTTCCFAFYARRK